MIKVTFPDGGIREYAEGTTAMQIAESISPRLAAGRRWRPRSTARSVDLNAPHRRRRRRSSCYKWEDPEGKHALLAHRRRTCWPKRSKRSTPASSSASARAIENGFYYDVDSPDPDHRGRPAENRKPKMEELARTGRSRSSRDARFPRPTRSKTYTEKGDHHTVELIEALEDGTISVSIPTAQFTDLCRGPHLPQHGCIKAIKLTVRRRRLLARRREARDADAHLRHHVP